MSEPQTDQPSPKTDPWDNADYYECSDYFEELSHESAEEAIESYLDGCMDPGCNVEAVIRANSPISCIAFTRKTVAPEHAKHWARSLADLLNELWIEEELGNPDEEADGPGTSKFVEELMPILDRAIARTHVWACEKVGKREFDADEVLAMMREHCSHWFEPEDTEPKP